MSKKIYFKCHNTKSHNSRNRITIGKIIPQHEKNRKYMAGSNYSSYVVKV